MKIIKESDKVVQGKSLGVLRACDNRQHALDKHDRDTEPPREMNCENPHWLERGTKHSLQVCGNHQYVMGQSR